jgi:hypothetical protein
VVLSPSSSIPTPNPGILDLGTIDILGQVSFFVSDCLVHCSMLRTSMDLCTLRANNTLPWAATDNICPDTEAQISPVCLTSYHDGATLLSGLSWLLEAHDVIVAPSADGWIALFKNISCEITPFYLVYIQKQEVKSDHILPVLLPLSCHHLLTFTAAFLSLFSVMLLEQSSGFTELILSPLSLAVCAHVK